MCVLVDALTWLDTSNLKSDMQVRFPSFVWFLLGVRWDQLIAHPFLNMLAAVWEHIYSSWRTILTETASSILNRYRCGIITQKRSFCVMSCHVSRYVMSHIYWTLEIWGCMSACVCCRCYVVVSDNVTKKEKVFVFIHIYVIYIHIG